MNKNKICTLAFLSCVLTVAIYCCCTSFVAVSEVMAGQRTCKSVSMTVLMYHAVHTSGSRAGDYVITTEQLEQDLQYITQNGYNTVLMSDVIDFVQNGNPLPDNPVMITFDDGYYNNYLNAYPLLVKYDCKAVISLIGIETERYSAVDENRENYSHITWEQAREMCESGLVEIQHHSYDMHKLTGDRVGCSIKYNESDEQYKTALTDDLLRLQDAIAENLGAPATTFAFPFGIMSQQSHDIIAQAGITATLGAEEKMFIATPLQTECLRKIPRYNRSAWVSAQSILAANAA